MIHQNARRRACRLLSEAVPAGRACSPPCFRCCCPGDDAPPPPRRAVLDLARRYCRAMPLRNRVTPLSELITDPARGLVYGNRGCLHDDRGEIRRRFATRRWIACRLEFKGWRRKALLQPGRFTELFFLDEATAFAAGHRPCALCRREDYDRFGAIWADLHGGEAGADAIDLRLHGERVDPHTRGHRTHEAPYAALPDAA